MRLIDADELKKKAKMIDWLCNKQVVSVEDIDNAPTVNPTFKPICDDAIQYTKGYQDGFLEGKKLAERPHIIDNCDMNVFEPEKYMEDGAEE